MATYTLATLRSRIRLLGNYESSIKFTDAFLNDQINEAIGDYCDLLDETHEGYRDTVGTVATVANTATVALPADFHTAKAVDILVSGVYRPLRHLAIRETYGFDSADEPIGYIQRANLLELFPTPDGVYTIRLRYTPTASVLSEDADSIDVPQGWVGFIEQSALLLLAMREQRPVDALEAKVARLRARIVSAAKRRQAEPEYLVPPHRTTVEEEYL